MDHPLTIIEAAERIRQGKLTPTELLEQCLSRIDRLEETIRAWAYLDRERAKREAKALTTQLENGIIKGPLHGIPVGIKDIVDVFDMPTGCGSKLWSNSFARQDADCVKLLRQAGALILGKTVTTPFAYLDPAITRNPYNLERTPGGSSSGSAAAVATGMALVAIGTQTGGSVIRPASYCGICAIKPTYNFISSSGILPLAPSLDHVGFMAKTVSDLEIIADILIKPASTTQYEINQPELIFPDTSSLAIIDAEMDKVLRNVQQHLVETGVDLSDREIDIPYETLLEQFRRIFCYEAALYHSDRWERRPADYPEKVSQLISDGMQVSQTQYDQAKSHQQRLNAEVNQLLEPNKILITPASTGVPPGRETTGNPVCNAPWSYLGLPTLSLPVAYSDDALPLAVQLVTAAGGEADLFRFAKQVQQSLNFQPIIPSVIA